MATPKVTRFCSIMGCPDRHWSKGYCSRHYQRWRSYGDPLHVEHVRCDNGTPLEKRVWSKIDKRGPDECWPWIASCNPQGYGRINVAGKFVKSHRIAYELAVGAIPDGLDILHSCDNPPCCNPAHLRPGTPAENTADKIARDRQPRGERHHGARLTERKVCEMRLLRAEGMTFQAIAKRFQVHRVTARHACLGITWGHVA